MKLKHRSTTESSKALKWFILAIITINMYHNRKLVPESHLNDFATEIPMHALSEEERNKIWSDHLHLTEEGYDLMAEIIYKKLKVALELFLKGKVSEKQKIAPKA